jgi:hypothetical protein
VNLTAAAAFTAAVLSLVNVAATYHLARRGHRENWRREQERPIVARCLTLSAEARGKWWDASVAKQDMSAGDAWAGSKGLQHIEECLQLVLDLRYEVAQLDLLASRPVRQAAGELVAAHEKEGLRLVVTKRGQEDYPPRQANYDKLGKLQGAFVERTRTDLGLGPSLPVPPRSLLGKILARDQD